MVGEPVGSVVVVVVAVDPVDGGPGDVGVVVVGVPVVGGTGGDVVVVVVVASPVAGVPSPAPAGSDMEITAITKAVAATARCKHFFLHSIFIPPFVRPRNARRAFISHPQTISFHN